MSERNGDKARFNRETKKHRPQRQRNRELRKSLAVQAAGETTSPPGSGNPIVAPALPALSGDTGIDSGQDDGDPEIRVSPSQEVVIND